MNKELSPLEALKTIVMYCDEEFVKNELKIVKTALKNYEEGLYNAKTYVKRSSSQALYDLLGLALKNVHKSFWKLPEQLFDDVNKSLKALETIKECFEFNGFDDLIPNRKWYESKEKQDLVKEVLL